MAKPDNYDCTQGQDNAFLSRGIKEFHISSPNITTTISFKIRPSINRKDYLIATLGTLTVLGIAGIILTVVTLILNRYGTIAKGRQEGKGLQIYGSKYNMEKYYLATSYNKKRTLMMHCKNNYINILIFCRKYRWNKNFAGDKIANHFQCLQIIYSSNLARS